MTAGILLVGALTVVRLVAYEVQAQTMGTRAEDGAQEICTCNNISECNHTVGAEAGQF